MSFTLLSLLRLQTPLLLLGAALTCCQPGAGQTNQTYVVNSPVGGISVVRDFSPDPGRVGTVGVVTGLTGSAVKIAVDPSGTKAYAAMQTPNAIAVIDSASMAVIRSIPLGSSPTGLAVTPNG